MNFRKNQVLIIGGGIALLLLIMAVILLFKNSGEYRANKNASNSSWNRLKALNERNPFPSAENTRLAQENLDLIKDSYEKLQGKLMQEQIAPENIEPARFAPMLEEAIGRVAAKARENRVTLPTEAGLGFKDYAQGKLPSNDRALLDRLVVQIKALEDLIGAAIDAKVSSVDTLQRDDFDLRATPVASEEQPALRGRGRGAMMEETVQPDSDGFVAGVPAPVPNPQYQTERFVIGVTGRENAIWDFLNRLVSRPIVYSIADVTIDNTRTDVGRPVDLRQKIAALEAAAKQATAGRPGAGTPTVESLPREERIVGGRDPVRARIVVDMYRFFNDVEGEGTP
jgi:hypothetical protein